MRITIYTSANHYNYKVIERSFCVTISVNENYAEIRISGKPRRCASDQTGKAKSV